MTGTTKGVPVLVGVDVDAAAGWLALAGVSFRTFEDAAGDFRRRFPFSR
jgi:hypothetical protein